MIGSDEARLAMAKNDVDTNALPELEVFVDRVLCDGQYVHSFQERPHEAAVRLGMVLSPDVAREVSATTRGELMARVWQAKLNAAQADTGTGFPAPVSPDVYIVILVVIVVLCVVVYIVVRGRRGKVNDHSPNKGAKL
jgi:hypothetical protein